VCAESESDCSQVLRVFNTAVGLIAVGCLAALGVSASLLHRGCSGKAHRSMIGVVSALLGALFVLVAISYFAGEIPQAFQSAAALCDPQVLNREARQSRAISK